MYNLNYAPTSLGVQSRREIISGGTRTTKVEYHCHTVYKSRKIVATEPNDLHLRLLLETAFATKAISDSVQC
jgi:hypothetical protein